MNQSPPFGRVSIDGSSFLILKKPAIICCGIGLILLGILALTHRDIFFASLFTILGVAFVAFGFTSRVFKNISHAKIVSLTPEKFIIDQYHHIPLVCVTDVKYLGRYDKFGMQIGFEILISPVHAELGNRIFFLASNREMKKRYKDA